VYVIAENERDALVGLKTAEKIARDVGRTIVLAVSHVVPYGTELDACGHNLRDLGHKFADVAQGTGIPTEVRVCACREARHLFDRMLVDEAVVVVPGRRGRWLRSRRERLAHVLASQGHIVTFADTDQPLQEGVRPVSRLRPALTIARRSDARRHA
jgi:hypothetical protein